MNARSFSIPTALVTALVVLSACGNDATTATSSPSSSAIETSAPLPSVPAPTASAVEEDVAKSFRTALENSIELAKSDGMTEVWSDADGVAALVVAWSPEREISSTYDIEVDEGEAGDFEYTTLAVALADLDSLEAGDYEGGVVSKSANGDYVIQLSLEGDIYLSTYRVNSAGLIVSGDAYVADELLGSMLIDYSITPQGQSALDAV